MRKILLLIILFILLIPIVANVHSIFSLIFTNQTISKAHFTPYYYAKVDGNSNDIIVFKKYMKKNGWELSHQDGGLFTFVKGAKTKQILGSDIKTIVKNNKITNILEIIFNKIKRLF